MIGAGGLEDDTDDFEGREPFDQGAMAFGVVGEADGSPAGEVATSRKSFEMSTPTFCARVRFIFSESYACLAGITPGVRSGRLEKRGVVKLQCSPSGLPRSRPFPSRRQSGLPTGWRPPNFAGQDGKIIRQAALSERGSGMSLPFSRDRFKGLRLG
jgi:hypothetical protein